MMEKTPIELGMDYSGWSTRQLSNQVLALYDQIERATLENLEMARKNSQLEIQIETIDQVIRTHHRKEQPSTQFSPLPQPHLQELQNQQMELAERVARIEELLRGQERRQGKDSQNTLHKVTSITDLMRVGRRPTIERGRPPRQDKEGREETARKSKCI